MERAEAALMVVVISSGCILLLVTSENFGDGHGMLSDALLLALYGVLAFGILALVAMLCKRITPLGAMVNKVMVEAMNLVLIKLSMVNKVMVEAMNLVLIKLSMVSFISMAVAVTGINFFLTGDGHDLLFTVCVSTFFTVLAVSSGILQLAIVRSYAPRPTVAETLVMIV